MRKLISSVILIVLLVSIGTFAYVHADTYEEESDLAFLNAFEQILSDEGITVRSIKILKEPIYDLSLNQLGYMYSMDLDDTQGYALSINTDGFFEVAEIYLDSVNPYAEYSGQKVYVSLFLYLVFENDTFIETSTGTIINAEAIDALSEKAFSSNEGSLYTTSEVINYVNRTQSSYELSKRYPGYVGINLSNGCVPTAGGNIIGYYTRFFPELMPNYVPGSYLGSYYLYTEMSDDVLPMMNTLYNYMGTNTVEAGTTIAGFKSGMTRFVNEKARSITFNSCMQGSTFNYVLAKQRLSEDIPLVFFVDTYRIAVLSNGSNSENITYTVSSLTHAMAGFGYREITYALANGQTRKDTYIAVATGLSTVRKGYYNINVGTQIDEVYSIAIS